MPSDSRIVSGIIPNGFNSRANFAAGPLMFSALKSFCQHAAHGSSPSRSINSPSRSFVEMRSVPRSWKISRIAARSLIPVFSSATSLSAQSSTRAARAISGHLPPARSATASSGSQMSAARSRHPARRSGSTAPPCSPRCARRCCHFECARCVNSSARGRSVVAR
jgi:hypothetical protein